MRIIIDYESSWRNSFLDGSNNELLPKKGRNFVGSMTELKKSENYHKRDVTFNTVMGILNRLIGDQRKLYQARESDHYYFSDIEKVISFKDIPSIINQEIAYIRNMKGSTDQNSFTGMIKVNDPIFQSDYSQKFWGIIALDIHELCDFILDNISINKTLVLEPITILNQLEVIKKIKPVNAEGRIKQASDKLAELFKKYKPLNKKGEQLILPMYCSALYLQLQRLEQHYDMSAAKSKMGGISGISNNGFTPKDFMKRYTTGDQKKIYGNPYIREEYVKGEGKVKHTLTKVSGQLEIILDVDVAKAKELKQMIDCAGVSSFYLGKKGLAYVSAIKLH
ncbi:type I-Fv CRISPR-associated protein Cas5fv [Pasteurella skyensis]|uniref:Type I-Fv CRISPR-associated protein Cas5fv n=1 Tax=Phocoenobacter skyensis TaxID=97481 RepID=A0AAJ6NDH0_9PAST|nr:type I-Fv CRISPR-associated protein Cas5fv [Pasteurella skyensis]MDP8170650.1 type I-Fv CRISPR-associated protein Cas5fv [Pasteurella skyensis]MDP8174808.1 type I-Fv CRISPR-associated protein Cas5fv [Pasteurella skyensis]